MRLFATKKSQRILSESTLMQWRTEGAEWAIRPGRHSEGAAKQGKKKKEKKKKGKKGKEERRKKEKKKIREKHVISVKL